MNNMNEDSLLDDFDLGNEATGELLATAGSLSRWLVYVGIITTLVGIFCSCWGFLPMFQSAGWEQLIVRVTFWTMGALWLNAARWQFKFIRWSKDLAARKTPYDQEHWVYLNYRLWQWLVLAVMWSIIGLFFF